MGALRDDPGGHALTAGIGWYATTHSMGLYGTSPPAGGFRRFDTQAAVDATPQRTVVEGYEGSATIETYTVSHDRAGAREIAFVAARTPESRRTWTSTRDDDLMLALETEELLGAPVRVKDGEVRC